MARKSVILGLVVGVVWLAGLDAWLLQANRALAKLLSDANDEIVTLRTSALEKRVAGSGGGLALTAYNMGRDQKQVCAACNASPPLTPIELDRAAARQIDRLNEKARKAIESAPRLSLEDLRTRYLPGDPSTPYTLVVFFSPTDCPACLNESGFWERLHESKRTLHVSVLGIADRTNDLSLPRLFVRRGSLSRSCVTTILSCATCLISIVLLSLHFWIKAARWSWLIRLSRTQSRRGLLNAG